MPPVRFTSSRTTLIEISQEEVTIMTEDQNPVQDIAASLTFRQLTAEEWDRWKTSMRDQPQWFVIGKKVWTTDHWRAIAGPFSTPEHAQEVADRLADDGVRGGTPIEALMYRTRITSLTETVQIYQNNINVLVDDIIEAESRRERLAPDSPANG
jgi:hypothetical protein